MFFSNKSKINKNYEKLMDFLDRKQKNILNFIDNQLIVHTMPDGKDSKHDRK